MSFVPLKNLIPQIITPVTPSSSPSERGRSTRAIIGQGVFELFRAAVKEVCGDVVSAQIQPLYINGNILVVVCLSAAAGDILRLKKKEVLANVNKELRGAIMRQLRCVG